MPPKPAAPDFRKQHGAVVEVASADRKRELYASLQPPAWYVVCARRDYRARDDLQALGIGEVWFPECRVVVTRRRTRDIIDGPLFPGYLFVRGVLTDEWHAAVLSVGDVQFLRMQSRPIAAREQPMADLRRLISESGGRVLIECGQVKRGFGHVDAEPFSQGQQLRVIDGPFTSFNGLYNAPDGADRIKILLDILGRPILISLPEASVEAVA